MYSHFLSYFSCTKIGLESALASLENTYIASLLGRIIFYRRRHIPWGRQLVTQPAVSLKHPVGQTRRRTDISPKHLAKPHSLSRLLTLGLEQTPCRPLCIKHSCFANSHAVAFHGWALCRKILRIWPACHKRHHRWRHRTRSSQLHKQRSSPATAQNTLQARTVSPPQAHTKSCHRPSSTSCAVTESRKGFGHGAVSLASPTSTRTRLCLKHKKPVLK